MVLVGVLVSLSLSVPSPSQASENSSADCNVYTYAFGFNHAKSVRQQCDLSDAVLQSTYDLAMTNPCSAYRLGFKEGWAAYLHYCSTNGGGSGGPGGGSGPDPDPTPGGTPIK